MTESSCKPRALVDCPQKALNKQGAVSMQQHSTSGLFSILVVRVGRPMLLGITSVPASCPLSGALPVAKHTFPDVIVVVCGGRPFIEHCSGACGIQLLGVGGCNLVHQMGQADVVAMGGQKSAPKRKT